MKKTYSFIALTLLLTVNTVSSEPAAAVGGDNAHTGVGAAASDDVITLDEDEGDVITAGEEIEVIEDDDAIATMPAIVEFIEADYPQELKDEGVHGTVLLELIVGEEGAVDSVYVVNPLHPILDTAAMAAVRRFKFSPARLRDGTAVPVMLQYAYEFTIPVDAAHDASAVSGISTADSTNIAGDTSIVSDADTGDTAARGGDIAVINDSFELTVYGREKTTEVAVHRLTISEVRRIPGLGGEAARVVQSMPGVGRPLFGSNQVIVRGAPSWATRYFIDGVNVPLLYHIGGTSSSYPSDAIEAVDFYPGGYSTRFGGQVGGVIDMKSRKSNSDSLRGHVDLSVLDGALFVEGPITENVSFMASGRRGFAGDILAFYFKTADPKNTQPAAAPFYWDFLLRSDVKINDDNDLFVTFLGSRDSVGVFIPSMDMGSNEIGEVLDQMNLKIMFYTLTAGLDSRLGDRWKNTLRLSGSHTGQRLAAFGMADMNSKMYMTHLLNQLSYTASEKLTVNIGADVNAVQVNIDALVNNPVANVIMPVTVDGVYGIMGGYLTLEWRPTDRLLLVPGIRYDYYPELDYKGSVVPAFWDYDFMDNRRGASGEPAFRVSGQYEAADGHAIKAAIGTYSQSPEPYGIVILEGFGEPNLPSTKGAHHVAGYEWRISDLLSFDAQAYYNRMWDIPRQYEGAVDLDREEKNFYSDGHGRTYGLELMLRHSRSDKFFGWITYTLSRSETWSMTDDKFILSSRDEPHHLQLLGSWQLKNNWDMGVRARFVSGRPTSPIIRTVEDANTGLFRPIYGERNSERLDPFFQVDLRADKKIEYAKWTLTYYVDLQNVLWPLYKSPEFTYYNYNYTERQKIAMIPLIATGIRAEF